MPDDLSVPLHWLPGARGAPSAHNAQPWRFAPLPDGRVLVRWDAARTLPASDPTHRDLYLSLGAAIEGARLWALQGWTRLDFVPADERAERAVGWLVPERDEAASPSDRELARFLGVRQTVRGPHEPRPVPFDALAALRGEAERHGCGFHVAATRPAIRRLADLAAVATAAQLADPAVHAELWRWLRLDPRDPAYRRDGLTADCLELHGASLAVARELLEPGRMGYLSRLRLHRLAAADDERVARHSAAICLLTTPDRSRAALVETGRLLHRLWLLAARDGLTTHPLSALLDRPETLAPTAEVFGARPERAVAIFRLGYAPPAARSPRLPPAELIEPAPSPAELDALRPAP